MSIMWRNILLSFFGEKDRTIYPKRNACSTNNIQQKEIEKFEIAEKFRLVIICIENFLMKLLCPKYKVIKDGKSDSRSVFRHSVHVCKVNMLLLQIKTPLDTFYFTVREKSLDIPLSVQICNFCNFCKRSGAPLLHRWKPFRKIRRGLEYNTDLWYTHKSKYT